MLFFVLCAKCAPNCVNVKIWLAAKLIVISIKHLCWTKTPPSKILQCSINGTAQAQTNAELVNSFFTPPNFRTSQFIAQIFTRNEDDPIVYVSLILRANTAQLTDAIRLEDFGGDFQQGLCAPLS